MPAPPPALEVTGNNRRDLVRVSASILRVVAAVGGCVLTRWRVCGLPVIQFQVPVLSCALGVGLYL